MSKKIQWVRKIIAGAVKWLVTIWVDGKIYDRWLVSADELLERVG
jgi:hypothetical protein